jgi:hypothetical protein
MLTVELKEAFSRCKLTRSRMTGLALAWQGIKNLELFKNENKIQNLKLSMKWFKIHLKMMISDTAG